MWINSKYYILDGINFSLHIGQLAQAKDAPLLETIAPSNIVRKTNDIEIISIMNSLFELVL